MYISRPQSVFPAPWVPLIVQIKTPSQSFLPHGYLLLYRSRPQVSLSCPMGTSYCTDQDPKSVFPAPWVPLIVQIKTHSQSFLPHGYLLLYRSRPTVSLSCPMGTSYCTGQYPQSVFPAPWVPLIVQIKTPSQSFLPHGYLLLYRSRPPVSLSCPMGTSYCTDQDPQSDFPAPWVPLIVQSRPPVSLSCPMGTSYCTDQDPQSVFPAPWVPLIVQIKTPSQSFLPHGYLLLYRSRPPVSLSCPMGTSYCTGQDPKSVFPAPWVPLIVQIKTPSQSFLPHGYLLLYRSRPPVSLSCPMGTSYCTDQDPQSVFPAPWVPLIVQTSSKVNKTSWLVLSKPLEQATH